MSERQHKRLAQKEFNRLKRRTIEKVLSNTKTSNVAFSLNHLVDGWLELDSDPGTFSLLIEDLGCFGAQVEEIYDLEQKFDCPVLGFIFLFKWVNHQQSDRSRDQKSTPINSLNNNCINNGSKTKETNGDDTKPTEERQWSYVEDESIISNMFFAKQMISNSCATHALISILLNCDCEQLNLGPHLTRLKEHTRIMDPENKGYAIGNLPEIAKAHNSHASYSSLYDRNNMTGSHSAGVSFMVSGNQRTSLQQQKHQEAYHFVSYVPIKNHLYELDGLKNYPIDHGPIGPKEDWTDKFRRIVKQRLSGNDIMYNLMAVVPDKRFKLRSQLRRLRSYDRSTSTQIKMLTNRVYTESRVNEVDIPRPPYSPLSTGTQTASEACNSPNRLKDDFSSEDEDTNNNKSNFYCIRFGERSEIRDSRPEPAHKNCIIEVTPAGGLDMTKKLLDNEDTKSDKPSGMEVETPVDEMATEEAPPPVEKPSTETPTRKSNRIAKKDDAEDVVDEEESNNTTAHRDEKYNLSGHPPFEFNIIDEMQHIHIDKSTIQELKCVSKRIHLEIKRVSAILEEENEKRRKFRIDNSRRTHNYEPFIMTFLSMLAKQGNLADLIEREITPMAPTKLTTNPAIQATTTTSTTSTPHLINNNNNNNSAPTKPAATTGLRRGPKPAVQKYRYVKTGRPVGRPRKNPLPTTNPT